MKKPLLLLSSLFLLLSSITTAQSSNNAICSAVSLSAVSTCGATSASLWKMTQDGPSSACGTPNDIWFKFTVGNGAYDFNLSVTTTGSSLTAAGTYFEVFKNITDCNNQSPAVSLGCQNATSSMMLNDLATGTYYVRVFVNGSTISGASTNWTFNICLLYAAPRNDECVNAYTVAAGTTNTKGTVWKATTSSAIPVACATGTPDDDVWYKFIPSTTYATITVHAAGSNLDAASTMIQAFSGTCGSLTSIGCGYKKVDLTGLTIGNQYYFRVYSATNGSISGGATGSYFKVSVTPSGTANVGSGRMREVFQQTIISAPDMLNDPWDVTYGTDGYLWITESKGYRVFRMDPATGVKDTVLNISYNSTFFSSPADQAFNVQFDFTTLSPQGGLAGLAMHPKFSDATSPQRYVYVSYIRTSNGVIVTEGGRSFTNSLVRFTFNPATKKLESPETIIDTLPGSNDHNSQRIVIAPVVKNGTPYLFYASGDLGGGQLNNTSRPNKSQLTGSYEGKILRFNLAPTGSGTGANQWIPDDNPYNGGSKSAIWVTGIRNNQGFAYDTATNTLYGSSHGPYSDDEVNIIEKKRNYGHPNVIGFAADENYAGSGAGANSGSTCPTITSEVANAQAIDMADPTAKYKDPLYTAYARTTSEIHNIWLTNPGNGGWPSEGWSGMDIYTANLIPGWKKSLLIGSLKWGRVLRLRLDNVGDSIVPIDGQDTVSYFGSINRFRDLAFSPDGKDMYVVMDKSTTTSGPSANNPVVPSCQGCLQKYTFLGYASDGSNKSTIPTAIDVTAGNVGTCTPGTTINISGANNNLWVPITGPDGNIMAEIKANGQDLGNITSSFYKSPVIRNVSSKKILSRNITINSAVDPSSPIDVRLYLTKAELDALIASPGSGVSAVSDLRILRNTDGCVSFPSASSSPATTTYQLTHGTNGYVMQGQTMKLSSFYFGPVGVTLPLELLTFKGKLVDEATALEWTTSNEKQTQNFVIERSVDSRQFSSIGTVGARGTTTGETNYSFTDHDAINQSSATLYYRLKMVDVDGKFRYSNIITISLADVVGKLTLAPNPASHEVKATVTAMSEGTAKWQLIDNGGRAVMSGAMQLKTGRNVVPLNIAALKAGVYYLIVVGNGIDQKVKLQKI